MPRLPLCLALLGLACPSAWSVDADDLGDHPGFAHAMDIHTRRVDDFPVVFHYGQVRPEFDAAPSPSRNRVVLNSGWLFRFDPDQKGESQGWAEVVPTPGEWTSVNVPHCWDMMPGGRFHDWSDRSPANPPHYNGAAWYRLEFRNTSAAGKRHRLEFLGVQQRARLFLNGDPIAMHEGGGQPFSIDVTDHLREGTNLLAMKVIRRANHEPTKPGAGEPREIEQVHGPHPKAPDNWPYAGITREVSMIAENTITARKTLLRTAAGRLEAAVVVCNHGRDKATISVSLSSQALANEPGKAGIELAGGSVRVVRLDAELKPDAAAWSPDQPTLHDIQVRVRQNVRLLDEWRGSFGIRDFRTKGSHLLLNGKPIFLKGVAFYEETRARGAALLPEDHAKLFQQCREAGANFIRLHVGQRAPLAHREADRLGFMVTGEWGGFWYREKSMDAQTKDSRSVFQSHARCAIWDLHNHPSVVLWCTHNESHQFCPEYGRFVAKATELVRELDWQGRPVTWAAWHPHKGQPEFRHADVVGFNEYRGAMDPFELLEPDLRRVTTENPDKPLVILENGAWAKVGRRGRVDQTNTEDWQADLLRRQHAVLTRHIPPLAGYTHWILVDYRSRKFYTANREADGYSGMGLLAPDGQPKLAREVFRDLAWPVPATEPKGR
jgi:beta-glucuronidase